MAQEGGYVLNTGPVIPEKLGRRMAKLAGFEADQPGALHSLVRSCAEADYPRKRITIKRMKIGIVYMLSFLRHLHDAGRSLWVLAVGRGSL